MKSRQDVIILVDYNDINDLRSNIDGRYHYFYKILNTINNKYYYGIHTTDDIYDGYSGSGSLLKSVYKKYGKENCVKYIIKFFEDRKSLLQYEKEIINEDILEDSNCYNISLGGNGNYNTHVPVITKNGDIISVSKKEYINNKHLYRHPTSGKVHINNGIKNKMVLPKDLNEWLNNGWMIGETNKSCAGKILINRNCLEERFIFEEELDKYIAEGWIRGGKSRNKGQKSFAKNLFWITNGSKQKRINEEELDRYIAEGWWRGTCQNKMTGYIRITNGIDMKNIKPDDNLLNYYLSNGWWVGSLVKGMQYKSWINNGIEQLVIDNKDIDDYLSKGWIKGRLNYSNKANLNKIAVNKNDITIMIYKDDLDRYLNDGWLKGNPKSKNQACLNKIAINKDGIVKKIHQNELEKYLNEGWEKGMGRSIMKGRLRINNGVVEKFVSEEDYENIYKEQGFVKGLLKSRK